MLQKPSLHLLVMTVPVRHKKPYRMSEITVANFEKPSNHELEIASVYWKQATAELSVQKTKGGCLFQLDNCRVSTPLFL